ncbi:MAG: hypothetical protein ACPG8W_01465 [Candidatus Promineifilaceae bacterium]
MLSLVLALTVTVAAADNHADDGCVIPESGPWPPCATGGNAAPAPAGGNGCVIPDSGPWPPCATGGNTAPTPAGNDGCVIPTSGPWPPCATGGNAAPPPAPSPEGGMPEGEAPAEEQSDIVVIDFITIYYVSDPNEIIGVFPVILFNAELMTASMIFNWVNLNIMRDNLNNAASGDQAACDLYEDSYEAIKETAIFFVGIPGDWAELDLIYFNTFISSLDRTRPAYLSCFDAGRIDDFNRDLARLNIDETLPVMENAIKAALAKLEME